MNSAKVLQFKASLDALSYEDVLNHRFKDLTHYTSGIDFGNETLHVTFSMDIKVWRSYQKTGSLGQVYGVDLSNYLSRKGILTRYCVPVVSDKARASKGRKTIKVEYYLNR